MPETFLIYRFLFKDNLAKEWENKFWALSSEKLKIVQDIVAVNQFKNMELEKYDKDIQEVLKYYKWTRDEAAALLKNR